MFPNVRAEMARQGITLSVLAEKMEMGLTALSNRMNGKVPFTYDEAIEMKEILCPNFSLEYLMEKREEEICSEAE